MAIAASSATRRAWPARARQRTSDCCCLQPLPTPGCLQPLPTLSSPPGYPPPTPSLPFPSKRPPSPPHLKYIGARAVHRGPRCERRSRAAYCVHKCIHIHRPLGYTRRSTLCTCPGCVYTNRWHYTPSAGTIHQALALYTKGTHNTQMALTHTQSTHRPQLIHFSPTMYTLPPPMYTHTHTVHTHWLCVYTTGLFSGQ